MRFRASIPIAAGLLTVVASIAPAPASARTYVSFGVGVPIPYGGYYGPPPAYYGGYWARPFWAPPRRGYYGPRPSRWHRDWYGRRYGWRRW